MFDEIDVEALTCQHCGYDLRATPAKCPECGTSNPSLPRIRLLQRLTSTLPIDSVEPRTALPGECPVEAYASDDQILVRLLCRQFNARGILARYSTERTSPEGRRPGDGTYRIVVWSADEADARVMVKRLLTWDS